MFDTLTKLRKQIARIAPGMRNIDTTVWRRFLGVSVKINMSFNLAVSPLGIHSEGTTPAIWECVLSFSHWHCLSLHTIGSTLRFHTQ